MFTAKKYTFFETPGMFTRCNATAVCFPYESRPQYSLDFLCCEDVNWVVAHVMNPALLYIFLCYDRDPRVRRARLFIGFLIPFWYEIIEYVVVLLFSRLPIGDSGESDFETVGGLLFGDALVQGSSGVLLGYLICRLTGFVSPLSRWNEMLDGWHRMKHLFLFALLECAFLFIKLGAVSSNASSFLAFGYMSLAYLFIYRNLTRGPEDVKLVWLGRAGLVARDRAFLLYFLVAAFLALQNCGLQYMANDWYQVWFGQLLVFIGLGLAIRIAGK